MNRLAGLAAAALVATALAASLAEAAAPRRVLILHSFGRDFAPYGSIAPAFRTEFARLQTQPVVFQEASLDAKRSGMPDDENAFVEFLRNRHGAGRLDLVVVVGSPGLDFYLLQRGRRRGLRL